MSAGKADCQTHRKLPVGVVFTLVPPPAIEKVVRAALAFRAKATPPVRQKMDAAIRKSVKLDGFRDASHAPANKLVASVCAEIDHDNDRLGAAVLHMWQESQAKLRHLVNDHLSAADIAVESDAYCESLDVAWTPDEWRGLRNELAAKHDIDSADVALMLCLVAGRLPDVLDDVIEPLESLRFRRWLEELERLPNDAPDWHDAHSFADLVAELADEKLEELITGHVGSLEEGINEVKEKYKDELRYLDIDMSSWFEDAAARLATIPDAEDIVGDLKAQLKAYRPIRPQALQREEEKRRLEIREKSERAILELVDAWRQLMSQPQDSLPEVADKRGQYVAEPSPSDQHTVPKQDFDAMKNRLDELEAEHESLKAENARLDTAKAGMQLEKAQLGDQLGELKNELKSSRETEQYWRQAFVEKKRGGTNAKTGERASFAHVGDVIVHAQQAFADELLFALNGKSRKNHPFQKPDEVFDALAWLATEYHRLRPNPGPSPDFDRLLKEACPGWSYKPNQTETTMGMYPDWYKTSAGGKTYDLPNHIGKGNSHDPKNTIRIAFAWDAEANQVVVGFIGLHQRNRHS